MGWPERGFANAFASQHLPNAMKSFASLFLAFCAAATTDAAEPFHIYAPSPSTKQLWVISAKPAASGLTLSVVKKVDLGFGGGTIAMHPDRPLLYVAAGGGKPGEVPAATVALDATGVPSKVEAVSLHNGSAYLSPDRSGKFLLSANYGGGEVDVYALNESGQWGARAAGVAEGRKNAHCVLPSPDNRFVYIPYVKDTNALFQYRFDAATGKLTPLDPKDAGPPAGTGPRHMAYHPRLPIAYFSNEQHLGVSVYDRSDSGTLKLRQICDAVPAAEPKEGLSSSDIVITPNGRFLFAGIRGHSRDFDWISRYRIRENGEIELLGLTPADKIPWGFALSPDGTHLVVTAFQGETITVYRIGEAGELAKAASVPCDKNISDVVTR
jgi:6-phosphogluconolactonase